MLIFKKLDLQLFADGGESGEGATSGENSVAAEQSLLDLGVPKDKIRKSRARVAPTPALTAEAKANDVEPNANDNANPAEETKTEVKSAKERFKELMDDPELNKEMQATIQSRLKSAKASEETLAKITPALEVLARKYNLDPSNMDYDALAQAISDDNDFYESRALELGVPIEIAKKLDQQERESARRQAEQQRTLEQEQFMAHIQKLEQQGQALKAAFPNFDLRKELQDPRFARLTAPGVGLSVEDAFYAIHRNEIQSAASQVIAQKTAEKISNAIQAGQRRPSENGSSSQAPSVTTFDYANASKEQRDALKARIRRGEKILPGSEFK